MGRKKRRRNITLDPDVDEAIDDHPDDFSPFVNKVAQAKYIEDKGHALEDILTDEFNEEINKRIERTENKLAEMREQADEMRKRADAVDNVVDEVEEELSQLRGLVDEKIEFSEERVENREEDITTTPITEEATWDEVIDELSDMPYHKLAWHREDGGSPRGKSLEHTDTVNAALRKQAKKLGVHHDELLDKLVEEDHVDREQRFDSVESDH